MSNIQHDHDYKFTEAEIKEIDNAQGVAKDFFNDMGDKAERKYWNQRGRVLAFLHEFESYLRFVRPQKRSNPRLPERLYARFPIITGEASNQANDCLEYIRAWFLTFGDNPAEEQRQKYLLLKRILFSIRGHCNYVDNNYVHKPNPQPREEPNWTNF